MNLQQVQSKVTNVNKISKDGYIKPTIHFELLKLVILLAATGFNASFIQKNNMDKMLLLKLFIQVM